MGTTMSDSISVLGENAFIFANPQSITYTIPIIVTEVSAMFVDTTTFLVSSGVRPKALN
jgi:hypothetical protein